MIMKSLHVRLVVVMQVYRSAQKTHLTWIKGKTLTDTVLQFQPSEAWLKTITNKEQNWLHPERKHVLAIQSFKIFHFYASSNFTGLQRLDSWRLNEGSFHTHTNSLCLANVDKSHKKVLFLSDFSIIKDSYPGCGIFLAVVKQLYMCL